MLIAIIFSAVFCYGLAAVIQFKALNAERPPLFNHGIQALALIGLVFHGAALLQQTVIDGALYIDSVTIGSLIAFFFATWLIANGFYRPLRNLYLYLFPIAAAMLLLSLVVPHKNSPIQLNAGLITHILLSTLAYSFLVLATVQSALVNHQMNLLKQHRITARWMAMPPLQTMEKVTYELVVTGFILLTAAMISGIEFISQSLDQSLLHKISFTVIAWATYGILLSGHFFRGWRGAFMNRWLIVCFAILVLGFFGSRWLLVLTYW